MPVVDRPTRYCLKCYYVLDGLPENRCPECGSPFDPDRPDTYSIRSDPSPRASFLRLALYPVIMVPLLIVLSVLPLLGFLVLPLLLVAVIANMRRRRQTHAIVILALSPFALCFYWGVIDYSRGQARFRCMGLPSTRFYNIDPVYRCGRATGGCMVDGTEWMRDEPYNTAVRLMVKLFGPMSGSYAGPYPTQAEAEAVLAASVPVPLAELAGDRVRVSGRTINLDSGVGAGLFENTIWGWANAAKDKDERLQLERDFGPIGGAVFQGSVLVLRIPTGPSISQRTGVAPAMLVLIDCGSGRPFAYYGQGDYYHRFPPVRWSR
jgi:hypothetical protein